MRTTVRSAIIPWSKLKEFFDSNLSVCDFNSFSRPLMAFLELSMSVLDYPFVFSELNLLSRGSLRFSIPIVVLFRRCRPYSVLILSLCPRHQVSIHIRLRTPGIDGVFKSQHPDCGLLIVSY